MRIENRTVSFYNVNMNNEEKKELHMKQAGEYIRYMELCREKIYDAEIKEQIAAMLKKFRDLRDLQYWFDSGEKELDRFYDRYLPFLNMIMENYLKLETSWNFEELKKVKVKLLNTLQEFIGTMEIIMEILPQDEISDANAEVKAREAKEALEERFRLHHL